MFTLVSKILLSCCAAWFGDKYQTIKDYIGNNNKRTETC